MRGVTIGVLGVLLGVLTWAIDAGAPAGSPVADGGPEPGAPRADHLVCPLVGFIRSDSRMSLMASRGGTVELWNVSEGRWSSHRQADLGDTGGWIGGVPSGSGVVLAESGAGWSGAGMVNAAPGAISAWRCGESSESLMALGGATMEGHGLDLVLYNPYVWDSSSRVEILSELGEDTPPGLGEIYVPAGKAVRVSLDEPLRLRRFLGARVDSSPGRVAMALQQTANGDTAVVEGSVPHTDWWLPVPELGQAETRLLIASPSGSSFSYRIDLITGTGPIIGYVEEDFLPGQLVSTALSDLPAGVTGIRVSGAVPLVAALRMEGEGLLAVGPGAHRTSRRWFLPGAGDDQGRNLAWLLNPSAVPVAVAVSAAAEGAYSQGTVIGPESVVAFELDRLSGLAEDLPGYLVDAEEEIAVVWTSQIDGGAGSYSAGAPVD